MSIGVEVDVPPGSVGEDVVAVAEQARFQRAVGAAIYTGQSLDRNGDGMAVARQADDCQKFCADRGWTVVATVVDNDVSASSTKPRPGFARVLAMVDAREVDVVVVLATDRLVRKLIELETVIEKCERAGVRLATVSGDLDLSTDAGRLVGRILGSPLRRPWRTTALAWARLVRDCCPHRQRWAA